MGPKQAQLGIVHKGGAIKWLVIAFSFGMAVAFMMFIKELRRNGAETAATAKNSHQPPNFFFAISR